MYQNLRRRWRPAQRTVRPVSAIALGFLILLGGSLPTVAGSSSAPPDRAERAGLSGQGNVVGAGDLLEIRVIADENLSSVLSGQFRVQPDGLIDYPVLGMLEVVGVSTTGIASMIKQTIGDQVPITGLPFVRIVEFAPVYLLGDVVRPGPYPFQPNMTIMQLVLMTGGLQQPQDRKGRVESLRLEAYDLEVAGAALEARRARLWTEVHSDEPNAMSSMAPSSPVMVDIVAHEQALFDARQRMKISLLESYGAQRRTYDQEIAALTQSIELHEQDLSLLREQLTSQDSLAEKGLTTQAKLVELKRQLIAIQRQGLEYRTALFRAQQNRLAIEQRVAEVQLGAQSENLLALSDIELSLVRNRMRLRWTEGILSGLEAGSGPATSAAEHVARYTILRQEEGRYVSETADTSTTIKRGDIVRVDLAQQIEEELKTDVDDASHPTTTMN